MVESIEELAFLTAAMAPAPDPQARRRRWSWVKINEPCTGTVALAMHPAIAQQVATAMLGTATPSAT